MDRNLLPHGAQLGGRLALNHLPRRFEFLMLATFFLISLNFLTMPIGYAMWREVLGVAAGVDTADQLIPTFSVATVTPTGTLSATASITPSLQVVTVTPDITATPMPSSTVVIDPSATLALPTNLPPIDLSPTPPASTTELPPTTEPLPTEMPING